MKAICVFKLITYISINFSSLIKMYMYGQQQNNTWLPSHPYIESTIILSDMMKISLVLLLAGTLV